jgi:hypothetical protein
LNSESWVASAKTSDNFKASPAGRAAIAAAKQKAQQEQSQAAADRGETKH